MSSVNGRQSRGAGGDGNGDGGRALDMAGRRSRDTSRALHSCLQARKHAARTASWAQVESWPHSLDLTDQETPGPDGKSNTTFHPDLVALPLLAGALSQFAAAGGSQTTKLPRHGHVRLRRRYNHLRARQRLDRDSLPARRKPAALRAPSTAPRGGAANTLFFPPATPGS